MIPPLTSIRRPPLEIGETAGKALVSMLQGKSVTLPKFQSKLIIRESVTRRI
jgi:DNA-binding LacI/PurR family transcriptional regulator